MFDPTQVRVATSAEITEAVFKIFTPDQIRAASPMPMRNFIYMVRRRLQKAGPPPTVDELDGLRELAFEHLWAGTLDAYSGRPRQDFDPSQLELHIHHNCDIIDGPQSICAECMASEPTAPNAVR